MDFKAMSLVAAGSLLKAQAVPHEEAGAASPVGYRVVTVSREVGALGSTVAAEVGRRLALPVYDRAVLEKVAEEMRRPGPALERLDERPVSWLEDALSALVNEYPVRSDAFLKYLVGTVRGLAHSGPCVIVGRGANWIVPAALSLRVRLVALLSDRVRVIASRRNCSEEEAARWVERTERERFAFVKTNFLADGGDPHEYDLVLNTSRLTVGECAEVIVETFRRLERRRTKTT
jgi:cytidylate kinase